MKSANWLPQGDGDIVVDNELPLHRVLRRAPLRRDSNATTLLFHSGNVLLVFGGAFLRCWQCVRYENSCDATRFVCPHCSHTRASLRISSFTFLYDQVSCFRSGQQRTPCEHWLEAMRPVSDAKVQVMHRIVSVFFL